MSAKYIHQLRKWPEFHWDREPLVRHLDGHLWKLRSQIRGNAYRVIYFFFTGRRIVFLHGFEKKTQKTPRADLAVARQRHSDYLADREADDDSETRQNQPR